MATTSTVLVNICARLGGSAAPAAPASPSPPAAAPSLRALLLRHHEVLAVLLGLIINLLAGRQDNQRRLAELELQGPEQAAGQQAACLPSLVPQQGQQVVKLLPVLCDILNELEVTGGQQGAAAPGQAQKAGSSSAAAGSGAGPSSSAVSSPAVPAAPQQQQHFLKTFSRGSAGDAGGGPSSGGGAELTEAELSAEEGSGVAGILEMYAAMLLGFMLQANTCLRQEAAARLCGGSLSPVVAVIHSSLAFYLQAGAITDVSKAVLLRLLQDLGQGQGQG